MRSEIHSGTKVINIYDLGGAHGVYDVLEKTFRSRVKSHLSKWTADSYSDYVVMFVTNVVQGTVRGYLSNIDTDLLEATSPDGVSVYISSVKRVLDSIGEKK